MNRREALFRLASTASAIGLAAEGRAAPGDPEASGMGLVVYTLGRQQALLQQRTPAQDLNDPLTFLEHCRGLGAGGVQLPLGIRDDAYTRELRAKAHAYGMYVEGNANPPFREADQEQFEAEIRTAAAAGALAVRTVLMPGRRYEFFDTLNKYREFDRRARHALELAAPIVEKHQVRLAVENHKTHLAADQAELLRAIGSPFVGACVDMGNNLALLEDPLQVVETLAPLAFSVHLKDQAVQEYEDGFLLADISLGQGVLDLKRMVEILRAAQPQVRFSLELITRDPLPVPCLTDGYWVTFPDRPSRDLVRTLRQVRANSAPRLPRLDGLSPEGQAAMELANIRQSQRYARQQLAIGPADPAGRG